MELLTGYYALLVFGDSRPDRGLIINESPPVPEEPVPLNTVFRQPNPVSEDDLRLQSQVRGGFLFFRLRVVCAPCVCRVRAVCAVCVSWVEAETREVW